MFRLQKPLGPEYTEATPEQLENKIAAAKVALGDTLMILGHHYQRDEVIKFADAVGDSLKLSQIAAQNEKAKFIVFCGVHFMAESADILTSPEQTVILPDLNAGCSMADMANSSDVEYFYNQLLNQVDGSRFRPVTYINSSAAVKALVGRHGGSVCTSSNAKAILEWALGADLTERKVIFTPDEHLARNTALSLRIDPERITLYDPKQADETLNASFFTYADLFLWKGFCSVHQRFDKEQIEKFRIEHPNGLVIVHPECDHSVVEVADKVGSTEFIIREVTNAPPGSVFAIGTEIHLVHRLKTQNPHVKVFSLDPIVCPCATMARIDLKHLAWTLDGLLCGDIRNAIKVDPETAEYSRIALERMLRLSS